MKTYGDVHGDGGSSVSEQVARQRHRVARRLQCVDHSVAVMSGKGGVGKSSVAVQLASCLARAGRAVGIVDADVNGPSVAHMLGVRNARPAEGTDGISPPTSAEGVRVMGMDLFLPDDETPVMWSTPTQKDAFTWRESMETAAVREFIADTEWGDLDVLLFDLPPGTRRLPHLADLLPAVSAAIVVTVPARVARTAVARSIRTAEELLDAPRLGLVENMGSYVCPHCGEEDPLFPGAEIEFRASERELPVWGRIPFDRRLARAEDRGISYLDQYPDSEAARAVRSLADRITDLLEALPSQRAAPSADSDSDP